MKQMVGKLRQLLKRGNSAPLPATSDARKSTEPVSPAVELLAPVKESYRAALLSLYGGHPQRGSDGGIHEIDSFTRVRPEQGMWMYEVTLALKPTSILEVGMAYGYSSLYFLAAMARTGAGTLTSIDPFQHDRWKGVGVTLALAHAPVYTTGSSFRLVEERSDRAVVDLLREGKLYDLIFIDGNHRFDDVLVDFYLCDQICSIGGHIILDDMWMSSIKSVAAFIRSNRDNFVEVPSTIENTCMFKKVKEDDRSWNSFRTFPVAASA